MCAAVTEQLLTCGSMVGVKLHIRIVPQPITLATGWAWQRGSGESQDQIEAVMTEYMLSSSNPSVSFLWGAVGVERSLDGSCTSYHQPSCVLE